MKRASEIAVNELVRALSGIYGRGKEVVLQEPKVGLVKHGGNPEEYTFSVEGPFTRANDSRIHYVRSTLTVVTENGAPSIKRGIEHQVVIGQLHQVTWDKEMIRFK